jgi:predicted nucleotidyltransferase
LSSFYVTQRTAITPREHSRIGLRDGARNVRIFGSALRGDARPDSDIDLLVDVEPGRKLLDVIACTSQ